MGFNSAFKGLIAETHVMADLTNCERRFYVFEAYWAFQLLENQKMKVGNFHRRYFNARQLLRRREMYKFSGFYELR